MLYASSSLPGDIERAALSGFCNPCASLRGLASSGVCRATFVTESAVGSYSTVSPLPTGLHEPAVSFLLHSPRGHPHRALPGTLPYEARTFLPRTNARRRLPVPLRRARTYRAVANLSRFHAANGKSRSRNLRLARASSCRARSRDTPKRRPISASDNSSSGSAIIRASTMYRSRGSRFCTAS